MILLGYSPSFRSEKKSLASHSTVFVTTSNIIFPNILSNVLPPPYVVYHEHIVPTSFSLLGNFHIFTNPWFSGAASGQIPHLLHVKINPEVTQVCSPLMEWWWVVFNLVVPFVFQQLIYKKIFHLHVSQSKS